MMTRPRIPHAELARAAVDRNVPVIQLREKEIDDDALVDLARELVEVTKNTGTLLIVNDRPGVAAATGADGVHVGTSDVDAAEARALVGADALVGLSSHAPGEAEAAREAGADYIGVGPIFPTPTKPDTEEPIGLAGLAEIALAVPEIPKVAIGGLGASNALVTLGAGADFVAVVSAVCHADDPVAALDDLLAAIGRRSG